VLNFRALQAKGAVNVYYGISFFSQQPDDFFEQYFAVNAFVFRVFVRKMIANIAQIGGAQNGIAYCMNEHVGIGVAHSAFAMLYQYAAQPKLVTFCQTVHVVALSYA
jgi:hypothetical protein